MRKNISNVCVLMLFLFMFWGGTAAAEENLSAQETNVPVKLAVMPIIGSFKGYPDSGNYIYKRLGESVHVPLNGVLQRIEYIDMDKTSATVGKMMNAGIDVTSKEGLAQLAAEEDADILIGVKIDFMRQDVVYLFDDGPYLMSHVGLKLFVYDRRTDKYTSYSGQRFYNDTYSLQGTANALTQEVMDRLLDKANLKQYVQ
ncbi:hypothetical protein [Pectinatus cerevisiiphilus]|uniref:Uncharacterized protein n=1 Tax=Pectinatus cerevisiiphilus TaxID=86956 RepID=A0A4R3K621_9FIRM|nr:hypothetical protein [Pectinatus cerevisiiphilus]TCS78187.1 hypothetical protein EDC37_11144 [Pectinatus cerevisiiphilus]